MAKEIKPNPCGCGNETEAEGSSKTPERRKLLRRLAAGSAIAAVLPKKWTKPVVESVVLPAHAQASPIVGSCNAIVQDSMIEGPFDTTSVYVQIDAASVASASCGQGGDVIAQLLFGNSTLASDTVGSSCNGNVCVTSISLFVYTDQVPLTGGDFTVRFTWPGSCVCSEVVSLANT